MNMDIEDDYSDYPKNKLTFNINSTFQEGNGSQDYHYHSRYLNQAVQHQQVQPYHVNNQPNHQPNYHQFPNKDLNGQQYQTSNFGTQQNSSVEATQQNGSSYQISPYQKEQYSEGVHTNNDSQDSKFNLEKTIIDSQNQISSNNDDNSSKDEKTGIKKKKKKKQRAAFQDISLGPSLYEQQAYLLKGNILLELNRNEDSRDYVPIGFKTNPYNAWKPIQRVVVHQNYHCIEIQVANLIKPQEDFSFIIDVLSSYGDSKYRDLALSISKYQSIIQQTKELEQQLEQMQISAEDNNTKTPNAPQQKQNDKSKQPINKEEYEKAFFKQFYERAMEVLGSMNKVGENVFFAFTMGKFDKYGFYTDMFNFGVNKNFLLLLGSEMDQVSNAFLRNGWLEIFDYQTRISNAFQFVNLINDGFEREMRELEQKKNQYAQQQQHQQQSGHQQQRQQSQQQSGTAAMKETVSESVDIVVCTFDQIKVPAKMKIHDIKINDFALRINMIDISPNMIQQVHAIRQKYINEKKSVNYIQMFDENFIYTTESQNFLQQFYPNHSVIRENKNKPAPFEILETQEVRQEIEQLRCGYRFLG